MLLWSLNLYRHLEHIDVVWIVHGIQEHINLCLIETSLLQQVLAFEKIVAQRGDLLQEFLFLVNEIVWDLPWINCLDTKRHLFLDLPSLLFSPWERINVVLSHEVE